MPTLRKVNRGIREVVGVLCSVALTFLILWAIGCWELVAFRLQRWPGLIDAFSIIYPLLLASLLWVLRRLSVMRRYYLPAAVGGAGIGLLANILSLVVVQWYLHGDLALVMNGINSAGLGQFLLSQAFLAFYFTLGWLYGILAASLAVFMSRRFWFRGAKAAAE